MHRWPLDVATFLWCRCSPSGHKCSESVCCFLKENMGFRRSSEVSSVFLTKILHVENSWSKGLDIWMKETVRYWYRIPPGSYQCLPTPSCVVWNDMYWNGSFIKSKYWLAISFCGSWERMLGEKDGKKNVFLIKKKKVSSIWNCKHLVHGTWVTCLPSVLSAVTVTCTIFMIIII